MNKIRVLIVALCVLVVASFNVQAATRYRAQVEDGVRITYGYGNPREWRKPVTIVNNSGEIRYVIINNQDDNSPYASVAVMREWETDGYICYCIAISCEPMSPVAAFKMMPGGRIEGTANYTARWGAYHWAHDPWEGPRWE